LNEETQDDVAGEEWGDLFQSATVVAEMDEAGLRAAADALSAAADRLSALGDRDAAIVAASSASAALIAVTHSMDIREALIGRAADLTVEDIDRLLAESDG
jgi:hypothetical protein